MPLFVRTRLTHKIICSISRMLYSLFDRKAYIILSSTICGIDASRVQIWSVWNWRPVQKTSRSNLVLFLWHLRYLGLSFKSILIIKWTYFNWNYNLWVSMSQRTQNIHHSCLHQKVFNAFGYWVTRDKDIFGRLIYLFFYNLNLYIYKRYFKRF